MLGLNSGEFSYGEFSYGEFSYGGYNGLGSWPPRCRAWNTVGTTGPADRFADAFTFPEPEMSTAILLSVSRRVCWGIVCLLAGTLGADEAVAACAAAQGPPDDSRYAEVQVLDPATGRGVPLVELETVDNERFVTDNCGRIALDDPDLVGRETFFYVRSHGYRYPADGFGFAGARITPRPGQPVRLELPREMLAERVCRLTGRGRFRDSILLGYTPPLADSLHPGHVVGQDSCVAVEYRGQIYCFWGDTAQLRYPLGLFRVAGAVVTPPALDRPDALDHGLQYDYFVDPGSGFVRPMLPHPAAPQGVIWLSAVCVVPDAAGQPRLVGHYTRRQSLTEELEQGICQFDDARQIFAPLQELPASEIWRRPAGHPLSYRDAAGTDWLLFGSPHPNVRVRPTLAAILDRSQYEAWTCRSATAPDEPDLAEDGSPRWRWQRELPPVDSAQEAVWVRAGKLSATQTRFFPAAGDRSDTRIELHSGTVRWNPYRQRWLLLACQTGGQRSNLGEIWYAEADEPCGPFRTAVQVATHDRQSLYNICHHAWLDQDGGRTIHFEGTYVDTFSGNPLRTPRYNYNQLLFRLQLDRPELAAAHSP